MPRGWSCPSASSGSSCPTASASSCAAVGWPEEAAGSLTIRVDARSQPGFNLMTGGSVFINDVAQEKRFRPPDFVTDQGAASGFSVSIPGPAQAFGVIGGHVREHRTFTEDDASFLQSVANVLGAAIERRRGEEDVHHRATHDPLTGLANRTLLLDQLDTALRARGEVGPRPAVLFLDVDRFKLEAGKAPLATLNAARRWRSWRSSSIPSATTTSPNACGRASSAPLDPPRCSVSPKR